MLRSLVLVIPDLHGKTVWKDIILRSPPFDHVVFLGDYVASFDHTSREIVKNLEDIVEYQASNPNKVTLLVGNHDAQYLQGGMRCSGYRETYAWKVRELLHRTKVFENMQIGNV